MRITAYSSCPKCGEWYVLEAQYQPAITVWSRKFHEQMKWTCLMCGYGFTAPCADAKDAV